MATPDLTQLSTNWRKLQEKLEQEKSTSTSLKRKRVQEDGKKSLAVKRTKLQPGKKANGSEMKAASPKSKIRPRSKSIPVKKAAVPAAAEATAERPTTSNGIQNAAPSEAHVNEGVSPTAIAGKYIALDCEMVGFGPTPDNDSQLARVSLVDYHGHQLYDSYVLPRVPITDYRTHITGITAKTLKDARPFKEVQQDIATFLSGRIVVAHAIKNDLDVLQLTHPKRDIRDTSRHPGFRALSAGKAPALRKLAKEILGLNIQDGVHSSVEDAGTCMLLFRKAKDDFEVEHAKLWGRPKKEQKFNRLDGDIVIHETASSKKKKRKKSKR